MHVISLRSYIKEMHKQWETDNVSHVLQKG